MAPARPTMSARDSSGRKVSLLNDEPNSQIHNPPYRNTKPTSSSPTMVRSNSNTSAPNSGSDPGTPAFVRADSFDSQNASDPHSPITPTYSAACGRQTSYISAAFKEPNFYEHHDQTTYNYPPHSQFMTAVRPSYGDSRSPPYAEPRVYDEDSFQAGKGSKRYPCRFKDSHGCDRTFTTSGHASRHSKIHTAEKAVHCTFQGCQKKFTRADNMKQHLETHYKEKSRSSAAQKAAAAKSGLTMAAGVKKSSPALNGRASRTSIREECRTELPPLDPAMFSPQYTPVHLAAASPSSYGPLNMSSFQDALVSQTTSTLPTGLDALAFAADFQNNKA